MRTWHFEWLFVTAVLVAVNLATGKGGAEWIGALAVLLTFGHASISDRMAEKQASMTKPDVDCFRWSWRYFVGKEALWVMYFIAHHSYSALVGCAIFLAYPFWRTWYRKHFPKEKTK